MARPRLNKTRGAENNSPSKPGFTIGDTTIAAKPARTYTRRNKDVAAGALPWMKGKQRSGTGVGELLAAFSLVRQFQHEYAQQHPSAIGPEVITQIQDDLGIIRNMVTQLCQQRGLEVSSLRTGTGG